MKLLDKILLLAFGLCLALSLQAQTKREFRAAWLTTVWAIDWPKTHSQSSESGQLKQQEELRTIVDSLAEANMNAVFFQVRGFSDAMYKSKYEPWSQYLTGTRGVAPSYDPLQLVIDYAHQKGIEVHAWVNPYRYASSDATYGNLSTDYSKTHPEWLVNCGGITILNPSLLEVRQQICNVIADMVANYDLDGVIFDDYFYQDGYQNAYDDEQYALRGNGLSRADWRRAQVNLMVREVHDTIKALKPWVTFGIGPAGVAGKANTSAPVYGVEPCPSPSSDWQYNQIYSDPLAWYNEKTIDYMAPQIYWTIDSKTNYDLLCKWWSDMAGHFDRHMYVSHSLSGMCADGAKLASGQFYKEEIGAQMQLNRDYDRMGAPGSCWYGLSKGLSIRGFIQYIKRELNSYPALVPQMTWYRTDDCLYVSNIKNNGTRLTWDSPASNLRYAVYAIPENEIGKNGTVGTSKYLLGTTYACSMDLGDKNTDGVRYAVAVLDRFGNEFPARTIDNTTFGKSAAAQLEYPADNDNVLIPCYFSWNAASGADSYFFQLSKSADFSTVDYEIETIDTTFYVGKIYWFESNVKYYWRVRTRSINKEDTYSDIRSVTGTPFHMIAPKEGDTIQTFTPLLVCDSVAIDNAEYTFEIADAQAFVDEDIIFSGKSTTPTLLVPDSVLRASKNYYVRAVVRFGKAEVISDPIKFRTMPLQVPIPVIISPTDGDTIVGTSVTVEWKQQASSGYQVEFSQSESFPSRKLKKIRTDLYTHNCTYDDIAEGIWYVRVAAVKEGGLTDYSEVVSFVVEISSAVDDIYMPNQPTKVIEDGHVIIYRNGVRYDLLGSTTQ